MIFDMYENAERYKNISANIAKGFDAIASLVNNEPGRYEIDGDNIYANIMDAQKKNVPDSVWEVHNKYIDIHYVVSGEERLGYAPDNDTMKVVTPYDAKGDAEILSGDGSFVVNPAGGFVLFFPYEAHMPGVTVAEKGPDQIGLRKIVVKIKI